MQERDQDLWVFGYGSLMWRPGFDYLDRCVATLHGRRRAFCIYSVHHRGTPQRPGLVLGLAPGGSVRGTAYCIAASKWAETYAYLREREQVTLVYREVTLRPRLDDGRRVEAVVYIVDQRHGQYAGRLPQDEILRLVRQGVGVSGRNPAYVAATHDHLAQIGVRDARLAAIAARLGADDALP